MTSQTLDNPVARLYSILQRAKESLSTLQTVEARIGWAVIFDLQKHHNAPSREIEEEICSRLIEVRKLIVEAEQAIQQSEALHSEKYLRPFARLRTMVPLTDLSGHFGAPISQITEGDMTLLEMAADELSARHAESVVEESELKELRKQVDELFDTIKKSEMHIDLKRFILRQLEMIRRAIAEYEIRGTDRLQEALAEIIGDIYLNQEILERESDKPEVNRYKQLVSRFYSAILTASKLTPLLSPASKVWHFLTAGTPDIPPVNSDH